jgi:hypothetical protein
MRPDRPGTRGHFLLFGLILVLGLLWFWLLSTTEFERNERQYRLIAQARLRDIVGAIHQFHSDYQKVPAPAITSKEGTPLLSWRVRLLPYLDSYELFNDFRLDEPWDSEHNRRLIPRMPAAFRPVGSSKDTDGLTYAQLFVGDGALFEAGKRRSLGGMERFRRLSDILVMAEGAQPVVWTKPEDITFSLAEGPRLVGGQFSPDLARRPGVHLVFLDGTVRFSPFGKNQAAIREAIDWRSTKTLGFEE